MSREMREKTLKNWQDKLAQYEYELSITASSPSKFELNARIEECKQKIQELESELDKHPNKPVDLTNIATLSSTTATAKKILILSANPKGTTQLRLNEEVREIKEGLRRAKGREQFSIETAEAVRHRDIHRAVLDHEPQIIHFSGHGGGEEGLVFEDETGYKKFVDAEALAGLFELFSDQVECVVLNACYSEVQAKAIARHINYVIGMSKEIKDQAAIEFAVGFYDALLAGKPVEFAYKLGCQLIRIAGVPGHLTPQLVKKPSQA